MRETKKVPSYSLPANVIRVHNQHHAHAARPYCTACHRHGKAWLDTTP